MSNESINSLKREIYLLITLNQLTQKGKILTLPFIILTFHHIS